MMRIALLAIFLACSVAAAQATHPALPDGKLDFGTEGLVFQRLLTPELVPDEVFYEAFAALAAPRHNSHS